MWLASDLGSLFLDLSPSVFAFGKGRLVYSCLGPKTEEPTNKDLRPKTKDKNLFHDLEIHPLRSHAVLLVGQQVLNNYLKHIFAGDHITP